MAAGTNKLSNMKSSIPTATSGDEQRLGQGRGWATEVGQGDEGGAQWRDVVQTWGRAVGVGAERHVKRGVERHVERGAERCRGRGARLGGETRKEAERRDGAMQHVNKQMIKCQR